MTWDTNKAIEHLRARAQPPYGVGKCATYVREAIEAGGLDVLQTGSGSAKDYGPRLVAAGFKLQPGPHVAYEAGDIAVIDGFTKDAADGIKRDHLDGHLAMYDGKQWISDYKQEGSSPYPGSDFAKAAPKFLIYRYQ